MYFHLILTIRNCFSLPHLDLPMKRCSTMKTPSEYSRITALQKRIEQLEIDLARAREDNQHLNQRLTTTLSRINILKSTNQVRFVFSLFVFIEIHCVLNRN